MMGQAMNRRSFLQWAAMGGAAWAQTGPPNIVLLLADDLGSADLSCFGATELRTPHIDSLARDGVRFTQAYANAPECTPSRCALLTGRYQQRVGGLECAIGLGNVGRYDEAVWLEKRGELGLPGSETTIAGLLRARGYATALIGKWHLGYLDKFLPNRHGFDEFFGILGGAADYFRYTEEDGAMTLRHNGKEAAAKGYLTDLIGDKSVEWLARRRAGQPFFLYVPFNAPHNPFQTHEDAEETPVQWRGANRKKLLPMIERMDYQVGRILGQIDKMGARGNTIVVFLSDNGAPAGGSNAPLRGGKSQVWEGGIRSPMAIRWPGKLPAGRVTEQVTLMMDLTATLAAAAGVKAAAGKAFDGMDLLAEWRGDKPVRPRTVFWRYKREKNRRKAVRHGDWKYVWENGSEHLFALRADPAEKRDLSKERPEEMAAMRARLAAWEKEVEAPRLREFQAE
jgi:arylsulfatase A-like enzyme